MLDRSAFSILLFVILIIALPLGSNRAFAWSFIEILVGLSACLFIFKQFRYSGNSNKFIQIENTDTLPISKWFYLGFVFTQCLVILQLVPLPNDILSTIAPLSFDIWSSVNTSSTNTISVDIGQTQISLIKGLSYLVFIMLLGFYINSEKRILTLALTIFIAGVFQALYASIENLLQLPTGLVFDIANNERADGSFIYHNHLANYMLLTGSIGIGLLIGQFKQSTESRNKLKANFVATLEFFLSTKFLIRVGLITIIIALILTRSRMGNAAFFFSLALVSLISLFIYKKRPKQFTFLIISFFILDLIIVGTVFGVEKVQQRMAETSFASETRDDVNIDGLVMITDMPIFGAGAGSFYTNFPQYQSYIYGGFYDFAHNEYLQFMVEFGAIFVLVCALGMIYSLLISLNNMRYKNGSKLKALSFGCAIAIIAMLIHMTVDFTLQIPANTITFLAIVLLPLKINTLLKRFNKQE
jgi:hypothetical protein